LALIPQRERERESLNPIFRKGGVVKAKIEFIIKKR